MANSVALNMPQITESNTYNNSTTNPVIMNSKPDTHTPTPPENIYCGWQPANNNTASQDKSVLASQAGCTNSNKVSSSKQESGVQREREREMQQETNVDAEVQTPSVHNVNGTDGHFSTRREAMTAKLW